MGADSLSLSFKSCKRKNTAVKTDYNKLQQIKLFLAEGKFEKFTFNIFYSLSVEVPGRHNVPSGLNPFQLNFLAANRVRCFSGIALIFFVSVSNSKLLDMRVVVRTPSNK